MIRKEESDHLHTWYRHTALGLKVSHLTDKDSISNLTIRAQ